MFREESLVNCRTSLCVNGEYEEEEALLIMFFGKLWKGESAIYPKGDRWVIREK